MIVHGMLLVLDFSEHGCWEYVFDFLYHVLYLKHDEKKKPEGNAKMPDSLRTLRTFHVGLS